MSGRTAANQDRETGYPVDLRPFSIRCSMSGTLFKVVFDRPHRSIGQNGPLRPRRPATEHKGP